MVTRYIGADVQDARHLTTSSARNVREIGPTAKSVIQVIPCKGAFVIEIVKYMVFILRIVDLNCSKIDLHKIIKI